MPRLRWKGRVLLVVLLCAVHQGTLRAEAEQCDPSLRALGIEAPYLNSHLEGSARPAARMAAPGARSLVAPLVFEGAPGRTHSRDIPSLDAFEALAKATHSGGQKVVKIVYDRRAPGDPKLYFIDTNRFPYHYSFASEVLGYHDSVSAFNHNYIGDGEKRAFNLASLVFSPRTGSGGNDEMLLEIWTGDQLSGKFVEELFAKVRASLAPGIALRFHPLSRGQEEMLRTTRPAIPSVTTQELYKDRVYWPMNEGSAVGYVKFVDTATLDSNPPLLDLSHIAVYDQVPNDIGLVGGVITEEFQTPLSHPNVKSMNRGTPNMSLKGAKEKLRRYEGKPVRLTVGPHGYEIEELPPHEADRLIAEFWAARKPKLKGKITSEVDPKYRDQLVRLDNLYQGLPDPGAHQKMIRTVGAKAANLALIHGIIAQLKAAGLPGIEAPEPVGVPFNFFDEFMSYRQKNLDSRRPGRLTSPQELIDEILRRERLLDDSIIHPIEKLRPALAEMRAIMQRAKVPPRLLALFKRYVYDDPSSPIHYSKHTNLRLRSSTNSEDLEGFTGAGLYNSVGIKLYKKTAPGEAPEVRSWKKIEKDLSEKIPFVFSSLWNERAFQEREWFSLGGQQHRNVKVGIAVHGGFPRVQANGEPGERANGVAVTTNIFNPEDEYKIYINGQHFDLSVTNPPHPDDLKEVGEPLDRPYKTEQLMVTTLLPVPEDNDKPGAWRSWPFEKLGASSVKNGAAVLTDEEIHRLAVALRVLSDRMAQVYGKSADGFAIDVEWKVYGPNRTLWIKQARPFDKPGVNGPQ